MDADLTTMRVSTVGGLATVTIDHPPAKEAVDTGEQTLTRAQTREGERDLGALIDPPAR